MKKIFLTALLSFPLAAYSAEGARMLKGVEAPTTITQDGKTLLLNGMGLRTKIVFKVYVGALYLEKKSSNGIEISDSEQVKRMNLTFLRGVSGEDVAGAITNGFEANAGDGLPALVERMDKFTEMIPDVKKGENLLFIYRPGRGLEIRSNGKKIGEIAGKDFSDTLFRVWLGDVPADKSLKAGLLGK